MSNLSQLTAEDFKEPRHVMTKMALSGEKAVMVYGVRDGVKLNTIYGDILIGDVRLPTHKELNFINNATGGQALSDTERQILKYLTITKG